MKNYRDAQLYVLKYNYNAGYIYNVLGSKPILVIINKKFRLERKVKHLKVI